MKFECIEIVVVEDKGIFRTKMVLTVQDGITKGKTYLGQIISDGTGDRTYAEDWDYVMIFNNDKKWKHYKLELFEPVE